MDAQWWFIICVLVFFVGYMFGKWQGHHNILDVKLSDLNNRIDTLDRKLFQPHPPTGTGVPPKPIPTTPTPDIIKGQ